MVDHNHPHAAFARLVAETMDAQRSLVRTSVSMRVTVERSREIIAESHALMRRVDDLLARD